MEKNTTCTGRQRLVELLEPLATDEWFTESIIPDVKFLRANSGTPRMPVSYEPSIVIIVQGRKIGYLGDKTFTYDPYNYLVLSVPLPFECETIASQEEPLLGISIKVTAATISDLLMEMDDNQQLPGPVCRGIYSTPLNQQLLDTATRLLESLSHPRDGKVLGPIIVREIIYRVLCGEQGGALRSLAARHCRFHQIANILKRMHSQYDEAFDMGRLAKEAGMSSTAFHNNFKAVTAVSPLQYLKNIRLHKAKMLMVQDGLNASTAAGRVGYESASQFSREFKRYFGSPPTEEVTKMKSLVVRNMR